MSNDQEMKPEDFPILCEVCLGESPFLRMTKETHGKACKICERPFMVYRWRPGPQSRFKKTEVCPTCAKLKNVCQTCVLDLQFGLPVQVRDAVLGDDVKMKVPGSDVGRQWMVERQEKLLGLSGSTTETYSKITAGTQVAEQLQKLRRGVPYYKRNAAHICSFFVRGDCTRGDACPYRHEMPKDGDLAKQNIKDRYHGVNDPVAKKLLQRMKPTRKPDPPEDPTVTTLWVGGVDHDIKDGDLRNYFAKQGDVQSIRLVPDKGCAFVTMSSRQQAESAVNELWDKLVVNNGHLRIAWGKKHVPKGLQGDQAAGGGTTMVNNPEANKYLNVPTDYAVAASSALPPPPGMSGKVYYPSMDPKSLGAKLAE